MVFFFVSFVQQVNREASLWDCWTNLENIGTAQAK
jgi:hypothetical protein